MAAMEIEDDREPHLFVTAHLASTALVLLYICICVSSYWHTTIYVSSYREPHLVVTAHLASIALVLILFYISLCPRTAVYLYMCPRTAVYLYMCPHTVVYIYICVLILLYISLNVPSYCCTSLHVCPRTAAYVQASRNHSTKTKESTALHLYILCPRTA